MRVSLSNGTLKKRKELHMMIKRKITVVVSVFCLLLTLNVVVIVIMQKVFFRNPDPVPVEIYSDTVEFTEHKIQKLMKQHHLPGVAVSLIDDQYTIWRDGFGLADIDKEIPAGSDTVFKFLSVSKVFTAIETMRLVEEDLVDLDTPISEYLPGFTIQSRFRETEPITVRSILSHYAGLPRNECYWLSAAPEDEEVLADITNSLKFCHAVFPAGQRYKYSNIGPDILGNLIEKMRGQPFADYMQENLLYSIGMENSAFLKSGIPAERDIALGYAYEKQDYIALEQNDITSLPSGNLYTSLNDMEAFVKFLFRNGESNGDQIIQPETLQMMYENQYPLGDDPHLMGLGWKIARISGSELMIWHDGGPSEGIGSLVAMLPEHKFGIVLAANEDSFDGSVSVSMAVDIFENLLLAKYGIESPTKVPQELVDVDPSAFDSYSGRYVAFGEVVDVKSTGSRLTVGYKGIKLGLVPVGSNRFILHHWLLDLGLSNIFKLPIDLRELEFIFDTDFAGDGSVMIIDLGGITYEICPRYPENTELTSSWKKFLGTYDLSVRLTSGQPAPDVFGHDEIVLQDGLLVMPGVIGPLLPISETEIIILSGPFAGETMVYHPATGYMTHQWVVYKPAK